jgi:hypothetical protein
MDDLYRSGLPVLKTLCTVRGHVDFASFRIVSADEYLAQFGVSPSDTDPFRHQVFELTMDGRRCLVPALALMRGLFRPGRYLLATMFKPQALDQVAHLDYASGNPTIAMHVGWATAYTSTKYCDWHPLLEWLCFYKSARRMVGSIHEGALRGEISVTLPLGITHITLRGAEHGDTLFVTETDITAVRPLESPDVSDAPALDLVTLRRPPNPLRGTVGTCTKDVPLHPDGTCKTTDAEWASIASVLEVRRKGHPTRLCQRALLDGILRKFATDIGWKRADYEVGNWHNAHAAYRDWVLSGTFDEILAILRRMRLNSLPRY